ncbi:MAG: hypothetical protein L3J39_09410 [Verrucomicrobiales bacterium]|nr:hypothetical protein [Verrucomicrobiales bacterium]
MKTLLLNNWKAKLSSLLVAIAVWYLVKNHVNRPSMPFFPIPGSQNVDYSASEHDHVA